MADLQVVRPTDYRLLSEQQRIRDQVLAADRGTIYDRHGVELAVSVPTQSIFVDPKLVRDPTAEGAQLADALGLDAGEVEAKMRADNRFSYVARQVDEDVAARVAELDLPGVAFIDEPRRFAPNGELARSIVGTTDVDGVGISGLEDQYGDLLTGTPGRLTLEQAPDGRTIPVGEHQYVPPVPGEDLVLTLDRTLQYEAERILLDQVAEAGAKGGVAVVSRPETGEILAIANARTDEETDEVGVDANNAALTTVYEPGSVMKLVTAAAAIEEGLVEPATTVVVPDTIVLGEAEFSEHDYHGTVSWPVSQIISASSNVGTIKLAQMLGRESVVDALHDFGFGQRTPIDFPNESEGFVRPADEWWGSSIGSIPIGQGVSVTPVQMLFAYNAIATGGTYVPPRLVRETIDPDGVRRPHAGGEDRRIVSEDTADKMNLMLRGVVDSGTGTRAAVDGYTVAGKTGTARKPQPNGGYEDEYGVVRYQSTFVGFVPAENPALSVIVIIDEPGAGSIFGGEVAAPAFARIAEVALRRYDVPPPISDRSIRWAEAIPEAQRVVATGADGPVGGLLPLTPDGRVRALAAGAPRPGEPGEALDEGAESESTASAGEGPGGGAGAATVAPGGPPPPRDGSVTFSADGSAAWTSDGTVVWTADGSAGAQGAAGAAG